MKIEDSVVLERLLVVCLVEMVSYFIFAVLLEQEVLKDKMKKQ